jgi:cation transport ATPase-like protein
MTSDSGPGRKFWQIALADLELQLGTGRNGLSSAEAAARRLRYGPNTLEERRRLSLPLKFLSRFRNPLVIILLAAAVISALTGDLTSFIIISTIVLMSAVLDTVQEFRAEQAAEHRLDADFSRGRGSPVSLYLKRAAERVELSDRPPRERISWQRSRPIKCSIFSAVVKCRQPGGRSALRGM